MGLIVKKNTGKEGLIAIWRLDKTLNGLKPIEIRTVQKEATLELITLLTGRKNVVILYDEHGKPYIVDSDEAISISHSGDLVAIVIEPVKKTGIDIERIREKIHRIASKFMSAEELAEIGEISITEKLITCWCAKEALYKLYGKGSLQFSENIKIEPFKFTGSGMLKGSLKVNGEISSHDLCYEQIEEFILVHVYNG